MDTAKKVSVAILCILVLVLVINNFEYVKDSITERGRLFRIEVAGTAQLKEQCDNICNGARISASPGYNKIKASYNIDSCDCICSDGTENIITQIKDVGPCPEGMVKCGTRCLIPSSKKAYQEYSCKWECKTGEGNGHTCSDDGSETKRQITNWIVLILILIDIILIFRILPKIEKNRRLEEEKQKLLTESGNLSESIEKLKHEKENIEKNIRNIEKEIKEINIEKEKTKNKLLQNKKEYDAELVELKSKHKAEINRWEIKKQNAKGEARKEIESHIRTEKSDYAEELEDLEHRKERVNEQNRELSILIDKQKELNKKLTIAEEDFKKNNRRLEIKKCKDKWIGEYHGLLKFDKKGYFVFKDSGKYLHRYLYTEKYNLPLFDKETETIHHIDTNIYNNEPWNLIAIPRKLKDFNNHLRHAKIDDWESGIQQLKEQLGMDKEDFPEHIKKEMKKRGLFAKD
ncbi:MAG: hypothetical protein AABW88_00055 [Nanoarchaeota archaeon]